MPAKQPPPQDEVARALAAARKLPPSEQSRARKAVTMVYDNAIQYVIPKRKTVVRACLFAFLGILPVLLAGMMVIPRIVLPLVLGMGGALYLLGAGEDIAKQVRWMKRMSGRGPIFWLLGWLNRSSVKVARGYYGDKMDVLPKAPAAVGTSARGATRAVLKWIPQPTSQYSTEHYEVEMRHVARGGGTELEWISLSTELTGDTLELKPLTADIEYEVRVRAVNSKGSSEWRTTAFATKQAPTTLADGERAGGFGPGYTWDQSLKDDTLAVQIGPLPAGTRAKQLEVTVMPTTLRVSLEGKGSLLSGELFGTVDSTEVEWELRDAAGSGGAGRELLLNLSKTGKTAGSGPLWPCLLKEHPEIDVSGLKRVEKDLNEMLADLQKSTGMHAMDGIEYAKNMRQSLEAGGGPAGPM